MKSFSEISSFYKKRFAYNKEQLLKETLEDKCRVSIVIPAYREELEETLESLASCKLENPRAIELVIVLNHAVGEDEVVKAQHSHQYSSYHGKVLENGLKVYAVKAFDLPNKTAGVGLARKVGMDEALFRFASNGYDGLIVCLDGDCTVSENYLTELLRAESAGVSGLSIYYEHELGMTADKFEDPQGRQQGAIIDYEAYLRYYIRGLDFAGYPYAFHTIGSSMAVRASSYAKIGGMNTRKAGEDFYFLHKLFPHGNFYDLTDCTVFPSSRTSDRVPFGTGRAMLDIEGGFKDFSYSYAFQSFVELRSLFEQLEDIYRSEMGNLPVGIKQYLAQDSLALGLSEVVKRSRDLESFKSNFFYWFDGFKVLKYLHYAREHFYAEEKVSIACSKMLDIPNLKGADLLIRLRSLDKNSAFRYL